MGVAEICFGSPAGGPPLGSLSDGGPDQRRRLGARMPYPRPGTTGGRRSGTRPAGTGRTASTDPELGRVAAAWAAERSQWALELWKATEEKRATLVALKQSEETLHQAWRQMEPPWPGPLIAVPPVAPLPGGTPGRPAEGGREVKRQSHRARARAPAATNLLAGGVEGASGPRDEPLAEGGTSCPRVRGRSRGEQGASAEDGHKLEAV